MLILGTLVQARWFAAWLQEASRDKGAESYETEGRTVGHLPLLKQRSKTSSDCVVGRFALCIGLFEDSIRTVRVAPVQP